MGIKKSKNKSFFVSPLRYPGGKTCLAPKLESVFKKNFSYNEKITFVEPYAGGAGASLVLLYSSKVDKIIINDLDKAIYIFWKIAVQSTDYLIRKIRRTKITIQEWKKQKEIYTLLKNKQRLILKDESKLAFATLFLNRTNRSGIMNGGPIGGMNQLSKWKINERFTKKTIIERLERIKKNHNKIKVYNLDGIKLLKRLERQKKSNQYFILIDPPYFQKGQSLYLNNYKNDDHEDLSKFLIKSSLKKWIMTYNDISYIKNLYKKMYVKKFMIQHNAQYSKTGKEIMIFPKKLIPVDI
ncbi:MAG: hypothetical protein OXM55_03925 [Bdellovibrionales bacterium]|nr:hypothetical protein [Bdellovibrionales bacterium]